MLFSRGQIELKHKKEHVRRYLRGQNDALTQN